MTLSSDLQLLKIRYGYLHNDAMSMLKGAELALEANDKEGTKQALQNFIQFHANPTMAVVTVEFIEGFVCKALKANGGALLVEAMKAAGFEQHALSLVRAIEVYMCDKEYMIDQLEPEWQHSARRMYQRLQAGMP